MIPAIVNTDCSIYDDHWKFTNSVEIFFDYAPFFCFCYQFQYYFLPIASSVKGKNKVKTDFIISASTCLLISSYVFLYSLFVSLAFCQPTSYDILVYRVLTGPMDFSSKCILVLDFVQAFCQIPFKFYIGKEIFFILYDEIVNKGISSKIKDLKCYS